MMGWHIHRKNGKYNIWSTVTDSYLLDQWVDAETVKTAYVEGRLEVAEKSLRDDVDEMVRNTENNFCGLRFMKCSEEFVDRLVREAENKK